SLYATTRAVAVPGKEATLTQREYELLSVLLEKPGQVLDAKTLTAALWGVQATFDPARLSTVLNHLRDKIEPDPEHPRYLLTGLGGYRLRTSPSDIGVPGDQPITKGDLSVFNSTRTVVVANGKKATLSPNQYRLLSFLLENPGKILDAKSLKAAVWGDHPSVS